MFDLYLRLFTERLMNPFAKILSLYISPNQMTLIGFCFGLVSCISNMFSMKYLAFSCFCLNRICDCLDGIIARVSNQQSDFGGYLDIITDFTIYSLLPITSVIANPSYESFTLLSILLATYYVNSASLFMLSALIEKRNFGKDKKHQKTSVNMPPAFIEGLETYIVYFSFILFPGAKDYLFIIFSIAVLFSICQRLRWAYINLI